MKNNSSEVKAYMASEAYSTRGKRVKRDVKFEVEQPHIKIPIDERDRVLNKVREFFETGNGKRLNEIEEYILKEISGVYFQHIKKQYRF